MPLPPVMMASRSGANRANYKRDEERTFPARHVNFSHDSLTALQLWTSSSPIRNHAFQIRALTPRELNKPLILHVTSRRPGMKDRSAIFECFDLHVSDR